MILLFPEIPFKIFMRQGIKIIGLVGELFGIIKASFLEKVFQYSCVPRIINIWGDNKGTWWRSIPKATYDVMRAEQTARRRLWVRYKLSD